MQTISDFLNKKLWADFTPKIILVLGLVSTGCVLMWNKLKTTK